MNSRIEKWIQQVERSLQSDVTMQQQGEGLSGEAEEERRDQFSCGTGGPLGLEVRAEAQSIINALMAGESPIAADPPRLLSPDWSADLDIQSAASSIVDQLMSKPLDISLAVKEEQQRVTDPRVAMEMRHRKIQEKRKAREHAQRMEAKEKVDRKEARRRAEHEVLRLERERRAKEKADEALVQLEMTRIRKQMQEERARQQWHSDATITAHHHRDMVYKKSAAPVSKVEVDRHLTQGEAERPPKKRAKGSKHTRGTAMADYTSEHTSHLLLPPPPPSSSKNRRKGEDGRSRHKDTHYETCDMPKPSATSVVPSLSSTSSASSLVRMERVTAHEQRQRLKVMHKSFTHWQRLLVRLRVAGGRAAATWEWKAMLRAWREWKMAVEEKRKEKTIDVTSAVQNELSSSQPS